MSLVHTPTGRTRHRVHKTFMRKPVLVLQIEVHRKGWLITDGHGTAQDFNECYWKDATAEDVTVSAPKGDGND